MGTDVDRSDVELNASEVTPLEKGFSVIKPVVCALTEAMDYRTYRLTFR